MLKKIKGALCYVGCRYLELFKYLLKLFTVTTIGAFIMISACTITQFILVLFNAWPVFVPSYDGLFQMPSGVLELIALGITIGILEEGIFRYLIMDCFFRRWLRFPFWAALIFSALYFGLAHLNNLAAIPDGYGVLVVPQVVGASIMGLWLGYIYVKQGLHMAILSHAAYDFVLFYIARYDANTEDIIAISWMLLGAVFFGIFVLHKYIKHLMSRSNSW